MNSGADKKINLDYYNAKIAEHGQDVQALWNSIQSQQVRFKILSEIGDLNNRSILDVGCGFGDLYPFLKEQNVHPKKYVGIDINPQMIAIARRRLPEVTFEVKDVLDSELNEEYDYVIGSGIFNVATPNWGEIAERTISWMYEHSKIGVGVNFLSDFTTGQKLSHSHHVNPLSMLDFVLRNLSTRVVMRHDYKSNDFTLYIYKPFT